MAQNPTTAVIIGRNTERNLPSCAPPTTNAEGADSIAPMPPAGEKGSEYRVQKVQKKCPYNKNQPFVQILSLTFFFVAANQATALRGNLSLNSSKHVIRLSVAPWFRNNSGLNRSPRRHR